MVRIRGITLGLLLVSNAHAWQPQTVLAIDKRVGPLLSIPLTVDLVPAIATSPSAYTISFTRATTGYVADHEGLLRLAKPGEARFWGARRVENLVSTKSEDFTNGAWTKSNINATATTLTSTAANGTTLQTYTGSGNFVLRVEMSRITGTGNVDLTIDGGSTWTSVTLTGSPQIFSIAQNGVTNPQFGIRIVTSGDAVNASKIQLEQILTGQANTNPSEYVSVGVQSAAPYHGAYVDGVRYFDTLNGNTVASNVVTEATGAAISAGTLKGFLSESTRTNLLLYSDALDDATNWTKNDATIAANDATAPNGFDHADKLVEAATTASHNVQQSITKAASALSYVFSVYLKDAEKTKARLFVDDGAGNGMHVDIDIAACTAGSAANDGTPFTLSQVGVVASSHGFCKAQLGFTTNTATTLRSRVAILNSGGSESYAGSVTDGIYIWQMQLEQARGASTPIVNAGTTNSRNVDTLQYIIRGVVGFRPLPATYTVDVHTFFQGNGRSLIWAWGNDAGNDRYWFKINENGIGDFGTAFTFGIGTATAGATLGTSNYNTDYKFAGAIGNNGVNAVLKGGGLAGISTVRSAGSPVLNTLSTLHIGAGSGAGSMSAIKNFAMHAGEWATGQLLQQVAQ
ncbi:MAG: hypothetical protein HMLKMBBP_01549 [Planctomycetes bacterium]|nr:hypothetical protein [Planctomycetota bacterium]